MRHGRSPSVLQRYPTRSAVQDTVKGQWSECVHDALAVYLQNENSDPSYQMHFFVIECDGGSVIIETQFISEMYEGLYAIMRECFNTFTMLETE